MREKIPWKLFWKNLNFWGSCFFGFMLFWVHAFFGFMLFCVTSSFAACFFVCRLFSLHALFVSAFLLHVFCLCRVLAFSLFSWSCFGPLFVDGGTRCSEIAYFYLPKICPSCWRPFWILERQRSAPKRTKIRPADLALPGKIAQKRPKIGGADFQKCPKTGETASDTEVAGIAPIPIPRWP